jgi:hypothetical protein
LRVLRASSCIEIGTICQIRVIISCVPRIRRDEAEGKILNVLARFRRGIISLTLLPPKPLTPHFHR